MKSLFDGLWGWHLIVPDPDRLPLALVALFVVCAVGALAGPRGGNANPFYWRIAEAIFGRAGERMDRRQRKTGDLVFRGFLLCVFVMLFSFMFGVGMAQLARAFPFYGLTSIAALCLILSAGAVWASLWRLYGTLKTGKSTGRAYYILSRTTRTDFSAADDFAMTRAGMGLAARAFDKGVVAPLFWFVIAGLPGAYLYAGLAMLAWRFGRDGFSRGFGTASLVLERIAGFVPSLIAGLLIALAGLLTPTGGMTRALAGLFRFKGRARYAEGGLPVTAMAHALQVGLGGPSVDLDGRALQRRWAGPGRATARLESGHLRRALYLSVMAHLLLAALLLAAMVWLGYEGAYI